MPKSSIEIFSLINWWFSRIARDACKRPPPPIATAPIASGPSVGANAAAVPVVPHKTEATKIAIVLHNYYFNEANHVGILYLKYLLPFVLLTGVVGCCLLSLLVP